MKFGTLIIRPGSSIVIISYIFVRSLIVNISLGAVISVGQGYLMPLLLQGLAKKWSLYACKPQRVYLSVRAMTYVGRGDHMPPLL